MSVSSVEIKWDDCWAARGSVCYCLSCHSKALAFRHTFTFVCILHFFLLNTILHKHGYMDVFLLSPCVAHVTCMHVYLHLKLQWTPGNLVHNHFLSLYLNFKMHLLCSKIIKRRNKSISNQYRSWTNISNYMLWFKEGGIAISLTVRLHIHACH